MAHPVLMPKLGLTMTKGKIIKWLVAKGDPVQAGQPLLEVETEKLTNVVESPGSGVLLQCIGREGEDYPVTQVIGYVGEAGEALPAGEGQLGSAPAESAPAPSAAPAQVAAPQSESALPLPAGRAGWKAVSPLARKLAAQLGVDTSLLAGTGTGPGGRVVKADVLAARGGAAAAPPPAAQVAGGPRVASIIPYKGMRRAIGENMSRSAATAPHVTNHVMADAGALLALRKTVNAGVEDAAKRVSVTDLLVKLVANALTKMPAMNTALVGEDIFCYEEINIGLAVALEDGLVVPVLKNADKKSLSALSAEARALVAAAREGRLSPDDFAGGTFTLSNLGGYGSVDFFTPIINPPQAAILGVGRTADQVVPRNGAPAVRPMMGLSLSYDHRVIDGAVAAQFAKLLMDLLENPVGALL